MSTVTLGLHEPKTPKYIFVRNDGKNENLWYYLKDAGEGADPENVYITEKALTGWLKEIKTVEITTSEYSDDPITKVDFRFEGDRTYWVRSSSDSAFTKGMLLAINNLTSKELQNPLSVVVSPGYKRKNVLATLYNATNNSYIPQGTYDPETDQYVPTGKWKDSGIDFNNLLEVAIAKVNGTYVNPEATSTAAAPKPKTKPSVIKTNDQPTEKEELPELFLIHNTYIKKLRMKLNIEGDAMKTYFKQLGKIPSQMMPEQLKGVISSLAIHNMTPYFKDQDAAIASFDNRLKFMGSDTIEQYFDSTMAWVEDWMKETSIDQPINQTQEPAQDAPQAIEPEIEAVEPEPEIKAPTTSLAVTEPITEAFEAKETPAKGKGKKKQFKDDEIPTF